MVDVSRPFFVHGLAHLLPFALARGGTQAGRWPPIPGRLFRRSAALADGPTATGPPATAQNAGG